MSPHVFHVLLALSDGDRHGYGIILDVARQTDDRLRLGTGTLYTALARLVDTGWIEDADRRPQDDDERRRYYRLTATGRDALRAESERLERAVTVARHRRVLRRPSAASRRS